MYFLDDNDAVINTETLNHYKFSNNHFFSLLKSKLRPQLFRIDETNNQNQRRPRCRDMARLMSTLRLMRTSLVNCLADNADLDPNGMLSSKNKIETDQVGFSLSNYFVVIFSSDSLPFVFFLALFSFEF